MRRHLSGIPKNDLANEIIHPGIQGLRLDGFEPVAPIQMSIIARAMVVFPPWKFTRPTFDVATVKTFNRTEPFIFPSIYATRTNDRSLKTSAKKTWRHPPPPLGLSSKGDRDTYRGFAIETKRPRCFENALLNRSTSPCFPPSQDKSSKKRAIFAGEKWPIDELLVLFKPVNFIRRKGEGWIDRIGQFRVVVCFCPKMRTIYPSTKGEGTYWPNGGTNSWLVSCFSPEMRNPRWWGFRGMIG